MKYILKYFTKLEILLWVISIIFIGISFILFNNNNYLTFIASIIGVTSLIFNAKGNPIGQILMIIFSILYGIISYTFYYYGEMITYLGMTLPMSMYALICWLKNPYKGNKREVKINDIKIKEIIIMFLLTIIVTICFYFILVEFNTPNIIFSTLSISTSFIAAYLTARRSSYFAIAYACNDIILIILWVLASVVDKSYFCVVVCFFVFLFNDFYGFFNWRQLKIKQNG